MPGRSVITVFGLPIIAPSLRSTVTPGKFPTCWFEPVSLLKSVVFPLFWLPTSAKESTWSSGNDFSVFLSWWTPGSPKFGCATFALSLRFSLAVSSAFTALSVIVIFSASSSLKDNSYPWILTSTGSPIGANLTIVISAPGMIPISRKCWRSAPSPPTETTLQLCPALSSFKVITAPRRQRLQKS